VGPTVAAALWVESAIIKIKIFGGGNSVIASSCFSIKGEVCMNDLIVSVIVVLVIAIFAFLVIKSYRKKLQSGCCGASDEKIKKNKVTDKDKSNYPYLLTIVVDGMVCQNCQARVENALNELDGVWATANVSDGKVTIRMKKEIDEQILRKTVNNLGSYTVMKVEK
jgi:copper chaperone CopZ